MKSKQYHTVGTVPKYNIIIVQRGNIDTLTHKNDHSLSWLGRCIQWKVVGLH